MGRHFIQLLYRHTLSAVQSWPWMPWFVRVRLLRWAGVQIGRRTLIDHRFAVPSCKLQIGNHTYINQDLLIEGHGDVVIGSRVRIAPRVSILTGTHSVTPHPRARASTEVRFEPTTIEDGCWICANVTLLPGVVVRMGCVVAAGAVVTRSTEPNGLYVGVPARRKSELPG